MAHKTDRWMDFYVLNKPDLVKDVIMEINFANFQ
jgi:hypothetical protein